MRENKPSARALTPKCGMCDFYEGQILQYKGQYQEHLERGFTHRERSSKK